ncbi:MAG: hypothetical protein GX878_01950 [Firmicutes bacterium]|nr:hypothetical protein [Bacillota bacterium]
MKNIRKVTGPLIFIILSSLLAGGLLFFFISTPGAEEELPHETAPLPGENPLNGETGSALAYKNETVYVMLNPDGRVVDQRIVNRIYQSKDEEAGMVKDYGEYLDISNMTSETAPLVQDNIILWDSGLLQEGDIYYEGSTEKNLPVDFQIEYYLDGEKIEAPALTGKSGDVRIIITMKNNLEIHDAVSYRNYYGGIAHRNDVNYVPLLVQGTYTADLNRFSNIEATDGAGIITGQNVNISFMAFPYPEAEIVLSMHGEDIELSPIMLIILPQLPPIPDIDMEDDLMEMLDGIIAIEEGLTAIYEGTDEIYGGLDQFRNKSNEMLSEIEPLLSIIEELPGFVDEYLRGNEELLSQVEKLLEYIKNLPGGTPEIPGMPEELPELPEEIPGLPELPEFPGLPDQAPDLPELSPEQLEELIAYLETARDFVDQFDDFEQYFSDAEETFEQLAMLPEALNQLADGQKAIRDGLGEINSRGIMEMKKGLIGGVNESRYGKAKMELMRSLADGYRSHADNENNRTSSVQFIVQTENGAQNKTGEKDPGGNNSEQSTPKKAWYINLWTKFLDLFTAQS